MEDLRKFSGTWTKFLERKKFCLGKKFKIEAKMRYKDTKLTVFMSSRAKFKLATLFKFW
jgi:hypothetical protein